MAKKEERERERELYALCEDCKTIIPGLIEYMLFESTICVDWASSLVVAARAHHSEVPYGFGHNSYTLYETQDEAERISEKDLGKMIVSRASQPFFIFRNPEVWEDD